MTNKHETDKPAGEKPAAIPKDPKGDAKLHPNPGHQVPHGSGEGATGMQPGAGHPRGR